MRKTIYIYMKTYTCIYVYICIYVYLAKGFELCVHVFVNLCVTYSKRAATVSVMKLPFV